VVAEPRAARDGWTEEDLVDVERAHPRGMTVQEIVKAFAGRGEKLTEATFRKYVQLGLLPRSVRVARTGKSRGSQGLYPASVVRQIDEIRRLMSHGHTIEEIQSEFLFIRGEVESLSRQLEKIYAAIEVVIAGHKRDSGDGLAAKQLQEAREAGRVLLQRLEGIERRMSMRARMARAAV
jgi:DNA-binding transcriptional MerR regulator